MGKLYPFEYTRYTFDQMNQDQRQEVFEAAKKYLAQKYGPHINLLRQMGRQLIFHCANQTERDLICKAQHQIMLERAEIPVPASEYVPRYKINHRKYKIRVQVGGLLTTDLVTLWLHWNQDWDIKERIVENYEGTHAETGLMTLYVNFPNLEAIQNLPDSYEIYGHTIKIHHRKIANPCTECTALHPEITSPHEAGEECRMLREAYSRD